MYTEINLLFVLFCVLRQDISVCSPQGPGLQSEFQNTQGLNRETLSEKQTNKQVQGFL